MSELDLDELEQKARAATPGPWARTPGRSGSFDVDHIGTGANVAEFLALEDADHIAANSPDVTLSLIARVRAAEARVKFVEGVAHLNQSDALSAEQRAAFLTKMLEKERARIAEIEAALSEACMGWAALVEQEYGGCDAYDGKMKTIAALREKAGKR